MTRKIIKSHLIGAILFISICAFVGTERQILSTALGVAVIGLSLISLVWAWERIFLKKSIALAVSVIVFKYAILGTVIYIALNSQHVDELWFMIGLLSALPAVVAFGFFASAKPEPLEKITRSL